MNFRSFDNMSALIREKLSLIPADVDIVVGIPRSGMVPAMMIALLLNRPCVSISEFVGGNINDNGFSNRTGFGSKEAVTVLVVDDSCNTGASIQKAKKKIEQLQNIGKAYYCCIYATEQSASLPDFSLEIVEQPRVFEWNIMNHYFLQRSCLDFDGVLCVDPTDEENDDGDHYIRFLSNAKPLFIPQFRVGAIVTSRLEKYRSLTEEWLKKHGIEYEHLIMMDLPDMETRRRLMNHGKFKAEIYKNSDAILFIESNPYQAQEIFECTDKCVYCTGNNHFYKPDEASKIVVRVRQIVKLVNEKAQENIALMEEAQSFLRQKGDASLEECEDIVIMYPELVKSVYDTLSDFNREHGDMKKLYGIYTDGSAHIEKGYEEGKKWVLENDTEAIKRIVQNVIAARVEDFVRIQNG